MAHATPLRPFTPEPPVGMTTTEWEPVPYQGMFPDCATHRRTHSYYCPQRRRTMKRHEWQYANSFNRLDPWH